MFNKILVPVDGSVYSLNAAEVGRSLAEKYAGNLTLLHVINKSITNTNVSDFEKELDRYRLEGIKILTNVLEAIGETEDKVEAIISWGEPMKIILEEIKDKGYDIVVMGSRGLGPIRGMLLGSVCERVSRSAKCPVVIVKENLSDQRA